MVYIKQLLRTVLGDRCATWVHAVRLAWLAMFGRQDEIELQVVRGLLHAGDVAVDVGANGANWTLVLSRLVGNEGHVFAFEADPYYAEVTRKTIKLLRLNNVTFFSCGLSDRSETAALQVIDSTNARVSGTGIIVRDPQRQGFNRDKCVPVKLECLDVVAQTYKSLEKTRLIKCDVEGFELMVFNGAIRVLEQARPIIITEVGGAHNHGYKDDELFNFFHHLNYESFVAVSDTLIRPSVVPGRIPEGARPNRIMLPKELDVKATGISVECVRK